MRDASARTMVAVCAGALLLTAISLYSACGRPEQGGSDTVEPRTTLSSSVIPAREEAGSAELISSIIPIGETVLDLDTSNPRSLLQVALRHSEERVHDYRAVLTKQERIKGRLGKPQTIVVILRENPRRVLMTWIRNSARIRRALYIAGSRRNSSGEELFMAEPAGPIARALVGIVPTLVHDPQRESAGLGSIDQLGFRSMLRKIGRISARADELGLLEFSFAGEGTIDGRPTIKLIREIREPALVDKQACARLVVHLDRQWLVPVSVQCYADHAGHTLTRSYVFTRIEMNPGIRDSSFVIDGSTPDMNALLGRER